MIRDFLGGPVAELHTSNAWGMGSIPDWEIKIPHAAWRGGRKEGKKKNPTHSRKRYELIRPISI